LPAGGGFFFGGARLGGRFALSEADVPQTVWTLGEDHGEEVPIGKRLEGSTPGSERTCPAPSAATPDSAPGDKLGTALAPQIDPGSNLETFFSG